MKTNLVNRYRTSPKTLSVSAILASTVAVVTGALYHTPTKKRAGLANNQPPAVRVQSADQIIIEDSRETYDVVVLGWVTIIISNESRGGW